VADEFDTGPPDLCCAGHPLVTMTTASGGTGSLAIETCTRSASMASRRCGHQDRTRKDFDGQTFGDARAVA
jgi:hypothetical protein